MSEANYSFTTKVNGDLLTVRGTTFEEFSNNVGLLGSNLEQVITDLTLIQAGGHAAPVVNVDVAPAPAAAPQPAGWGNADPNNAPPAFAAATVPQCKHGARKPMSKVGAKGLWKGWFCPSPKGTADQCDPIFLNKSDAAAWDAFPA